MHANMYFSAPDEYMEDLKDFEAFLDADLKSLLAKWYEVGAVPRSFFRDMANNPWLGFDAKGRHFLTQPSLKQVILVESLSKQSPGVAVAFGAHTSLGTKGLWLSYSYGRIIKFLGYEAFKFLSQEGTIMHQIPLHTIPVIPEFMGIMDGFDQIIDLL